MTKVKYILKLFHEHPTGRQILNTCLTHNLIPTAIIQETSSLGEKKKQFYETAIKQPLPTIKELSEKYHIPVFTVDNSNDDKSQQLIKVIDPDLIVLGNTRIIKPHIFNMAKHGCLNVHPGMLPWIKGSYPVVWALLKDVPIGCTVHYINEGIDTGAIISQQIIPIAPQDTLESLIEKTVHVGATLMKNALISYQKGDLKSVPQSQEKGHCFSIPCDITISQAKQKLAELATCH